MNNVYSLNQSFNCNLTGQIKFSNSKSNKISDSKAKLEMFTDSNNITASITSSVRQLAIHVTTIPMRSAVNIRNLSDFARVHIIVSHQLDTAAWTDDVFFYPTSGFLKVIKKFNLPDLGYELNAEGFCE